MPMAVLFDAKKRTAYFYLKGGIVFMRAAIISAVLERPYETQRPFNDIVSAHNDIIRGRMGIPFGNGTVALISLTVVAKLDRINSFTGKLGRIEGVTVKATIANENIIVE